TYPGLRILQQELSDNFEENGDGTYTVNFEIKIPEKTPTAEYRLAQITVEDEWGNELYLSDDYNEFPELKLNVASILEEDLVKPEFIDISIDKNSYQAGETVKVQLNVKEKNELSRASVSFTNETHPQVNRLSQELSDNFE